MSLKAKMTEDLKAAMKSGDKLKLSAIRMVQSAVKNKEIDNRVKTEGAPAQSEDDMIIQILKTMVKQRKDSIEQFKAGGRQDLVDQETAELKIIESYLPQMMSKEQIEEAVSAAIAETKASSSKDMGVVMKAVMAKTQGKADGKLISEIVKSKLH